MLLPEDLVLPRTVSLQFLVMDSRNLELSSRSTEETYRFEIMIYSTLRGDIADLVELIYADMHGGGDLLDFPSGFWDGTPVGKVFYDRFVVKYFPPFKVGEKNVHSASIRFDAVVTRARSG